MMKDLYTQYRRFWQMDQFVKGPLYGALVRGFEKLPLSEQVRIVEEIRAHVLSKHASQR